MRPISRWRHLMSSVVTVASQTGLSQTQQPTYGTAVSYRAHLSRRRRLVRNALGDEVVSGQAIYLDAAPAVDPTAQVTLSTGDVGSTESVAIHPRLVSVERRFDAGGPHHTVLYME